MEGLHYVSFPKIKIQLILTPHIDKDKIRVKVL